eukprot:825761-Pelagomonas_calceolata.AAC.2
MLSLENGQPPSLHAWMTGIRYYMCTAASTGREMCGCGCVHVRVYPRLSSLILPLLCRALFHSRDMGQIGSLWCGLATCSICSGANRAADRWRLMKKYGIKEEWL